MSKRRASADALGKQVAQKVHAALAANRVPGVLDDRDALKRLKTAGVPDPRRCDAQSACLAALAGRLGGSAIIIGIDAGKVMRSVAVHVEAVKADGTKLAHVEFSGPFARWSEDSAPVLARFARELKEALASPRPPVVEETRPPPRPRPVADARPPPPVPDDRPVAEPPPDLEPLAEAPPPDLDLGASRRLVRRRAVNWPAWGAGGGAVAAAAVSVTFAVLGGQDVKAFSAAAYTSPSGAAASRLTEPEARALADRGNDRMTVAAGSAVGAAALTGIAAYLFVANGGHSFLDGL